MYKNFGGGADPPDNDPGFKEDFTLTFDIEVIDCSQTITVPVDHLSIIS